MKTFEQFLAEGTVYKYEVYHSSYTSAVDEALKYAKSNGYTYSEEDAAQYIGINSTRPSNGKTTKVSLPLLKNEKESKKNLQFQVYCMGDRYELNVYIQ